MSPEPERETPRQRRERIFVRRRSPRRGVALAVAVVGVFVIASVSFWVFHRATPRSTALAKVPLIRADEQPTRKRPADPGGLTVPEQDSIVLNRSEPKVEQLLPPPEAPVPRPTPAEPRAENSQTPQAETPPPAAAEPVPPPQSPASEPSVATVAPPAPPSSAPEQTARAAAPPPPAPPGKGYRLQLGSVRTPEGAKHEWERLQRENSDLLGRLGYAPVRADLGERGIFYRIQVGPLATAAAAERACDELKRRGIGCILVRP